MVPMDLIVGPPAGMRVAPAPAADLGMPGRGYTTVQYLDLSAACTLYAYSVDTELGLSTPHE